MYRYILCFFFCYIALTLLLPTWRVTRQTGQKTFLVPDDNSPQAFIGKIFRTLFLIVLTVVLVYAFFPEWKEFLLPATFLEKPFFRWTGLILLHVSLAVILIAQANMRTSWRIGFDPSMDTVLITSGLFRYSRNPVFLGMGLTFAGLFLALPNALTLTALSVFYVTLEMQVRLEEAYLARIKGDAYRSYMEKVPRWI